jgi:hypothetical protein
MDLSRLFLTGTMNLAILRRYPHKRPLKGTKTQKMQSLLERSLGLAIMFCISQGYLNAQSQLADTTQKMSVEEMTKKRQDPVAGLRSIYLQDVILPIGEGNANSFSIQPVFPVKIASNLKLITYTIIPFQKIPPLTSGGKSEGGMGNILFNGYFSSIEKTGKISWGVGPALQIPTRTNTALGSNRLCMGPTGLFFYGGDVFSGGIVAQNYWSLGGTGTNEVNQFSLQYIAYYNFSKGWFLLSNTTIESNWLSEKGQQWFVPLGGGAGKTFQMGKRFYCADAQFFSNVERPDPVGSWEAVIQFQIIL